MQEHWFWGGVGRGAEAAGNLGWQMIRRVQAEGLPFEAVGCGDLADRFAA